MLLSPLSLRPLRTPLGLGLGLALLASPLGARQDAVPTPAHTPVELVVSGRTSTLVSLEVADVGQTIPKTFAGDKLANVDGFRWFVSRHYALQTDYDAARARHLLALLELAFPHYVEVFGRELPELVDTRMPVVYGASKESLDTALKASGIVWDFGGGGITYEGFETAYQYPSGSLEYHLRYILLHECAHLYQICMNGTARSTPAWWYEGVADALAHHVWETSAQRLTVGVVDKPTINNWYDAGLEAFAREPFRASDILAERRGGRDLGFLLVHYFDTDPLRAARLSVWRDELFRKAEVGARQASSQALVEELFGAEALDRDFERLLGERSSSFRYVDWGFEQDGDALMSYGWPKDGEFSQTNLLFAPGDEPEFDPLRMDYPLHARSELVGAVRRGVAEPTVGCLVGFCENPDAGVAGLALGVEARSFARVLVEARRKLVVDTSALGGERRELELSDGFVEASSATFEIGLTVSLGRDELEVVARTGVGDGIRTAALALPIDRAQRERLLARPLAVLSRDGKHWLTPYVDDARRPEPELAVPAPPNRWRTTLAPELRRLARATWRLGRFAPSSLTSLTKDVEHAALGNAAAQAEARAKLAARSKRLRADVERSGADSERVRAALADLGEPSK
ncbi:MAG: hypothetical protein HZA52_18335 [Planctomycetes bacterium]|nr:hypothetical protein [Planctomycetota bacterium]